MSRLFQTSKANSYNYQYTIKRATLKKGKFDEAAQIVEPKTYSKLSYSNKCLYIFYSFYEVRYKHCVK